VTRILCFFSKCRWIWLFNAQTGITPSDGTVGVYQCTRCKTVSIGADQ
jgi:hypothetical protein